MEIAVCYGGPLHEASAAIDPADGVWYCGLRGSGPGARVTFPAIPTDQYDRIVKYARTYFNWFSRSNREIVATDIILWAEGALPDGWVGFGTILD